MYRKLYKTGISNRYCSGDIQKVLQVLTGGVQETIQVPEIEPGTRDINLVLQSVDLSSSSRLPNRILKERIRRLILIKDLNILPTEYIYQYKVRI